jgi:hypothetical protein
MKRRSKFTFFELKVTFYFDLFRFFIGGMYDEKDKSIHLSLIPFLVLKIENAKNMIKINLAEGGIVNKPISAWPTEESVKEVKAASKELLKHGKKAPKTLYKDAVQKMIKRKKTRE